MSPLLIILTLAYVAEAKKFSAEETTAQTLAEHQIRKVKEEAEATMPPCDAQRSLTAAMARHEPPASCPKILATFRQFQVMQNELIARCEEFDRLADELLAEPAAWQKDQADWPADLAKRYDEIRKGVGRATEPTDDLEPVTITEWTAYENGEGTGELADWRCGFAFSVSLQARKVQTTWFSRNNSNLNNALYTTDPDSSERQAYAAFRRGGERAYDEFSQSQTPRTYYVPSPLAH